MPLTPGTKLGPYEISAALGAGGMGEVYRANDTRLDRTVAIKVLPAHLSDNAELKQRFDREARAISSLTHPHICTLYDVGQQDGIDFLVMEFLEGDTLAQRLEKGALPPDQTLRYATQIAAALDKAHRAGIVHRDLKPGNIMLTKAGAKLLDFGLAKLKSNTTPVLSADSEAPTQKFPITGAGTILGTFQYMAPEQLEGREADPRTDIFALGAVIYEMATGRRAFTGKTQASLITAIMSSEPEPMAKLQPLTPPALERLVKKCLAKEADDRWQSAHDIADELQWIGESGAQTVTNAAAVTQPATAVAASPNKRQWLAWGVAAALLLSTLIFALAYFRRASVESQATFASLPLPAKSSNAAVGGSALSPDGRRVVIVSVTEGVPHLWLYGFERPAPVMLAGTEGARYPFWSPNGRSIGFFAQGKLKRIEAAGGAPAVLCEVTNANGGAWSSSGDILFSPNIAGYGLYRVSESGGTATPLTSLDSARSELGHLYPSFLPDGRHFLFFALTGDPEYRGIRLGSLDSPQTSVLLRADANAQYSTAGYLLFVRGRKILAQPFDPDKLALSGAPVVVTEEQVEFLTTIRYVDLSAYSDRILLYRGGGNPNQQLIWLDRSGRQLSAVGPVGEYRSPSLSPDGRQVIIERLDPQVETTDLWQFDLRRETLTRLTSNPASDLTPIWAPDGSGAAFTSSRGGFFGIYRLTGGDKEELLLKGGQKVIALNDWSSDGKFIVYRHVGEKTQTDISLLPLTGERQPRAYLATQFNEYWAKVSPDGRWLAYRSNESGRDEIYVQSFPEPGRKVTVSQGGGDFPRWRRDGKELYYIGADDKLMAVPVETGANFSAGAPMALFDLGGYSRREGRYMHDVSADGQKFLLLRPLEDATTRPLTVVQNWTALLKK